MIRRVSDRLPIAGCTMLQLYAESVTLELCAQEARDTGAIALSVSFEVAFAAVNHELDRRAGLL
jgi:hypothetical protein